MRLKILMIQNFNAKQFCRLLQPGGVNIIKYLAL